MMLVATIKRLPQNDCTVGILSFNNERCFTLELPDANNASNVSCIPNGRYKCAKIVSPSLGKCIEISGVIDREYIRIHSGNYTSQIKGCVLVGDSLKDINNDGIIDVTNSKATLENIMGNLPDEFEIIVS